MPTILKKMNCRIFHELLIRAPESPFERYMTKRIFFFFRLLYVFLRFGGQGAQKHCLRFAIFNFNEKLQNIFEIGLKKYGVFVQKSLSL